VRRRQPQAKVNAVRSLLFGVKTFDRKKKGVLDQETARELASALALEVSRVGETPEEWHALLRIGLVAKRDALVDAALSSPQARADFAVSVDALGEADRLVATWPIQMGEVWARRVPESRRTAWDAIVSESAGMKPKTALELMAMAEAPLLAHENPVRVINGLQYGTRRLAESGRRAEAEAAAALAILVAQRHDGRCLLKDDRLLEKTVRTLGGLQTASPALRVIDLLDHYPPDTWATVLNRLKLGEVAPPPPSWGCEWLVKRLITWSFEGADGSLPPKLVDVINELPTSVRERVAWQIGLVLWLPVSGDTNKDAVSSLQARVELVQALAPGTWSSPTVMRALGSSVKDALDGSVDDPTAASAAMESVVRTVTDAMAELELDEDVRASIEHSDWLKEAHRTAILDLTRRPSPA
jgi:hypothetical protein